MSYESLTAASVAAAAAAAGHGSGGLGGGVSCHDSLLVTAAAAATTATTLEPLPLNAAHIGSNHGTTTILAQSSNHDHRPEVHILKQMPITKGYKKSSLEKITTYSQESMIPIWTQPPSAEMCFLKFHDINIFCICCKLV